MGQQGFNIAIACDMGLSLEDYHHIYQEGFRVVGAVDNLINKSNIDFKKLSAKGASREGMVMGEIGSKRPISSAAR